MTYAEWFDAIAEILNDNESNHEKVYYKLSSMIAGFNDAMCVIAKYRPDLFTEYQKVKLQVGKYQDARGCCTNILDVLDQLDANGNVIKELTGSRKSKMRDKTVWNKPSCLSPASSSAPYVVNSAWIDGNVNGRFTVTPPVPCGVDAWVLVKCVKQPCPIDAEGINASVNTSCEFMVAARHYVLGWLLSGDSHSVGSDVRSQQEYRMFFDLLQIEQQAEKNIESPQES